MKAFTTLSALVALVASANAQLMVNTPGGLTECEPSQITWTTDNQPPYLLSVVPAGQTGPNLKAFPPQTGNAFTWLVDIAAGQAVTFALKDAQGLSVFSGPSTIAAGTSTSCVNATVNEGTATSQSANAPTTGGASPSSAASSGSSSTGTGTGTGTTAGSSASSKSSGTSTGTAATQSKTGAATSSGASVGVLGLAGVMGLIGAVLL